jgi:hypothetical protein
MPPLAGKEARKNAKRPSPRISGKRQRLDEMIVLGMPGVCQKPDAE